MSYDQPGNPPVQQAYPDAAPAQPAKSGTNGLAIAGFILAFLIAPIGLILSIIGLIQAGRRRQKGKGLAITGIIVSVVLIIAVGALIVVVANRVGDKVSTLTDPGCTTGRAAILDNADKVSNSATAKEALQATVNGLNSAATKATHDNVRNAMTALADDYNKLLQAVDSGTSPEPGLQDKLTADGATFDSLCTVGK
jgi:hypothetical protein